jgi:hypothetical protein
LWADLRVGPYGNTQENVEELFRFGFAKRSQPQLGVVGLRGSPETDFGSSYGKRRRKAAKI